MRIKIVKEWLKLRNLKDFRSPLELYYYLKRFIQGSSTLAKPLTKNLTGKGKEFVSGEIQINT